MLNAESDRQAMGCGDDGCLAEIAAAAGARFVVTSSVSPLGNTLVWNAALVDSQTNEPLKRASVRAVGVQGLVGQASDLALALAGREAEAAFEGAAAQQHYGFRNASDLASFKGYRQDHRDLTTGEALTQFIIARNTESDRLAAAQAVLFSAAAGVVFLSTVLGFAQAGVIGRVKNVPVIMLLGTGVLLCLPLAMILGTAGLVLVVVDLFNPRRVEVDRSGCCRQDPEIEEAHSRSGFQRAMALVVMLGGPAMASGLIVSATISGLVAGALVLSGVGRDNRNLLTVNDYTTAEESVAWNCYSLAFFCSLPALIIPCLCATPAGALLFAVPSPRPVNDVDEPAVPVHVDHVPAPISTKELPTQEATDNVTPAPEGTTP